MAEPRKVQFVTLSAFAAGAAAESRKRRLEEEADFNFGGATEVEAATGAAGAASNGRLGKNGDAEKAVGEKRATVRLNLSLPEPDDRSSAEFNYGELIQNLQVRPPCFVHVPGPGDTGAGVISVCFGKCLRRLGREGGAPCPGLAWFKLTISTTPHKRQQQFFFVCVRVSVAPRSRPVHSACFPTSVVPCQILAFYSGGAPRIEIVPIS